MTKTANTFYVPSNACFEKDLEISYELGRAFRDRGENVGLMLILMDGMRGLRETASSQLQNLNQFGKTVGNLQYIVMAPNLPLGETDFYHKPEQSLKNIQSVIDFADNLPHQDSRPIVTFHLNTLFGPEEWHRISNTFTAKFSEIIVPALNKLAAYSRKKNIAVKIETTPVPEFGDRLEGSLNQLGNPYPLYSGRGFREVKEAGLGIALDICHTDTLYKLASVISATGENGQRDVYKGLFPEDLVVLSKGSILDEVDALEDGDVVHLNDGAGYYDPSTKKLHIEGVALGAGDIKELPSIISKLMTRSFHIVLEINETDFAGRPETRKSIDYFMRHAYGE